MYQLELAGLEIFHKLHFPERSPYFLFAALPNSLFLFIVQSDHFVFLKTTCEHKPFMHTPNKTKYGETMGHMKPMWYQMKGNGHFLHFPIPFIWFCHVDRRQKFHTRKEKVRRQQGRWGREKKGTRKIKNVSRAEAGRKLPLGLSVGKSTSNCL